MSANKDTVGKTVLVATVLCIVCSILVSTAAVKLKPLQSSNKVLDMKKNILQASGLMEKGKSIDELFAQITPAIVDLETGKYSDTIDPDSYNQRQAAKDPKRNVSLSYKEDKAGIKKRAKFAKVYMIKNEDGSIKKLILPVHGKGLWSTMYGFLALNNDLQTVEGFAFYEQGETPGLGGEVDNPKWKKSWIGKKVVDENGNPVIDIVKGSVNPNNPDAIHQVDGLSGATITSNGVENTLLFWLGENGYGPYLANLREQMQ